jgi:hypothetical protein
MTAALALFLAPTAMVATAKVRQRQDSGFGFFCAC